MLKKPCIHQWTVLDKTILESGYEQLTKAGQGIKNIENGNGLFTKKLILTLTCPICGLLKTTIEENP